MSVPEVISRVPDGDDYEIITIRMRVPPAMDTTAIPSPTVSTVSSDVLVGPSLASWATAPVPADSGAAEGGAVLGEEARQWTVAESLAMEAIAAQVHEAWMATKRAQGISSRPSEWGEEQMVPYDQLSDRAKDLDRGTVRAVVTTSAFAALVAQARAEGKAAAEFGPLGDNHHNAAACPHCSRTRDADLAQARATAEDETKAARRTLAKVEGWLAEERRRREAAEAAVAKARAGGVADRERIKTVRILHPSTPVTDGQLVCATCRDDEPWPCPTVLALDAEVLS